MELTKDYIPTSEPTKFVKITLNYFKGDSPDNKDRGYRAFLCHVTVEQHEGYQSETFRLYSDTQSLSVLTGIPRRSKASDAHALKSWEAIKDQSISQFCTEKRITLAD